MASVVIVGNGPLKEIGKKIDAHDIVIRMGYAPLHLNKLSGKKIDIWSARGASTPIYEHLDKLANGYDAVWNFHGPLGSIPKQVTTDAKFMLKGNPTLGILTVIVALEKFKDDYPLSITGFSFLAPGQHHYWGGHLPTRTVYPHPVQAEEAFVEKAVKEGKLKWLT